MHEHLLALVPLADHLALAMDGRDDVAARNGHGELDGAVGDPEPVRDRPQQLGHAPTGESRAGHRARVRSHQPSRLAAVEVGLVERQQLGHLTGPDLGQDGSHRFDLGLRIGGRGVDDVHEQVGGADDLQGGVEGVDELMGQLAHETDRVRAQHGLAAGQIETPSAGVEGGEEPVLDEHPGVGEHVEQRRLAGVRVADERHRSAGRRAFAPCRWVRRVAFEVLEAPTSSLRMRRMIRRRSTSSWVSPGPLVPMPTGLLGERQPLAAQAREPVAAEGELDLRAALLGVGVLGEDVEDHGRPVDGGPAEDLLEVPLLGGRQLVVEDDRVGVHRLGDPAQLLRLAPPDVGGRVGGFAPLHDAGGFVGAGGVDEQGQLVEARLDLLQRCGARRPSRRARSSPGISGR